MVLQRPMNVLLLASIAFCLPSCVSVTAAGEKVRVTANPDVVRGCEFLTNLSSTSGWGGPAGTAGGTANNEATLRNDTAARGGNVLYLLQSGVHATGEAYRCPPATPAATKSEVAQAPSASGPPLMVGSELFAQDGTFIGLVQSITGSNVVVALNAGGTINMPLEMAQRKARTPRK